MNHGFGFFTRGQESVGVGSKADAVSEDGNREVANVVSEAIAATAKKGARACRMSEGDGRSSGRPERQKR
jgi:hypothetical protein